MKYIAEPKIHDWENASFQKIHSKGRLCDRLICRSCGAKAKKFGSDIEIDVRSMRDPAMRDCIPAVLYGRR